MAQQRATKLLAIVQERQCILLEDLLLCFPDLTWNQAFSLVDELSRQALICLQRRGFEYELRALSWVAKGARSLSLELPQQKGTAKD